MGAGPSFSESLEKGLRRDPALDAPGGETQAEGKLPPQTTEMTFPKGTTIGN